jgi:hypothetical protein
MRYCQVGDCLGAHTRGEPGDQVHALLWTEKLTLISLDHAPDEVYEQVRPHFTDEELANLTLVIATISMRGTALASVSAMCRDAISRQIITRNSSVLENRFSMFQHALP